jgi:hypothetical protein
MSCCSVVTDSDSSEDPLAMMAMAFLADITNLRSYREACTSGQWEHCKIAMDNELSKMDKYQVFEITPCLPSRHVLKACWVYTRKIDSITDKVAAYKARWVAKGYAPMKGLHFNDIYVSVVHKAPSVCSSFLSTHLTWNMIRSASRLFSEWRTGKSHLHGIT